jgi:hypothetical protein
MSIKHIVTHRGGAHRDDFMSVAIALAYYGCVPVFRRDPTEEELQDPQVLVLDCGRLHEPERLNFDHHQLPRDAEPECALSLFVRYLGLEERFKLRVWWSNTIITDAKGPVAAGKAIGLDRLPEQLISPIESTLLRLFASVEELPKEDCQIMAVFGNQLLEETKEYASAYSRVSELVKVVEVDGLECFVVAEALTPMLSGVLHRYRELVHPGVAVSITKSDREGESWALYRYDDDPRVDFSRCSGDQVVFAHVGGFMAKLSVGVGEDEALGFVRAALV